MDIKTSINDFLEAVDYNQDQMDYESLKTSTMDLIETIVETAEKIEDVLENKEQISSVLISKIVDNTTNLKRASINIDSLVNSLKESQNYILENIMKRANSSTGRNTNFGLQNFEDSMRRTTTQLQASNTNGFRNTIDEFAPANKTANFFQNSKRNSAQKSRRSGSVGVVTRNNRQRNSDSNRRSRRRSNSRSRANSAKRHSHNTLAHTETINLLKRQIEKLKKKAEDRKTSLKLLFNILTVKEKEAEKYKTAIENSKGKFKELFKSHKSDSRSLFKSQA